VNSRDDRKEENMAMVSISKISVVGNVRNVPEGCDPNGDPSSFPEEILSGLRELSQSIKEDGLLQPILVKEMGHGSYRVIAGWRRLMACKLAGINLIPASIVKGKKDDEIVLQLVENLQREDLQPLDIAKALSEMKEKTGMTQEAIAKKINKSPAWVSYHIGFTKADPAVVSAIEKGEIGASSARHIASVPKQKQKKVLEKAKKSAKESGKKKVSVSGAKTQATKIKDKAKGKKPTKKVDDRFAEQAPKIIDDFGSSQYGDKGIPKATKSTLMLFLSYLHAKHRLVIK